MRLIKRGGPKKGGMHQLQVCHPHDSILGRLKKMTSICCCFWYSIPLLFRNHQAIDGTTLCVFHDFHGTLISALYTFKWLL